MEKKFNIEGMTCVHCEMAVKNELAKLNLDSFKVTNDSATVSYDEAKLNSSKIKEAIEEAGYKVV